MSVQPDNLTSSVPEPQEFGHQWEFDIDQWLDIDSPPMDQSSIDRVNEGISSELPTYDQELKDDVSYTS
jgi:hypothetical protein